MIYTLTLNADELNLIALGLSKLPFEVASPMIEALRKTAKEQEAAHALTTAAETTDEHAAEAA